MVSSAEKCSVLCVIMCIILCNIPSNLRLAVDGLFDNLNYTYKYIISHIKLSKYILFLFNLFFYIMWSNISTAVPLVPLEQQARISIENCIHFFFNF